MTSIVSEDQTGFIRQRHHSPTLEGFSASFHTPSSPSDPEVIISLDTEKAFDRVEWSYLFTALQRFGFGDNFVSWIRFLYASPQASVCTNTSRSKTFPLSRGTRQGCPLSPLLFGIAIEPLSIALKMERGFLGIQRWGTEHKVSLYADDLLLYVRNPSSSIPRILSILDSFSTFSGYKLNVQKSECFPVNQPALDIPAPSIPFQFSSSGFKYLLSSLHNL